MRVASSFRDPSGYVFREEGVLYRRINPSYEENYRFLMDSGLYQTLVNEGLLIPHEEVELGLIRPEEVGFISYPYEWSFGMLKAAALALLDIQRISLEHGMVLKDASAYNFQFHQGVPLLIDTLSFEKYVENQPWYPYRQFCQHFLAPLALMKYRDVRLSGLLKSFLDGIPLDLAVSLLPGRFLLNWGLLLHLKLHSSRGRLPGKPRKVSLSQNALKGIVDSLRKTVASLDWEPQGGWSSYYREDSYPPVAFRDKERLVREYLEQIGPKVVLDIGANTGVYSTIAAELGAEVVAVDSDPMCTELHYRTCLHGHALPLVVDIVNPSPGIGWGNKERVSFRERVNADTVLALALVHHLAIGNNLPLDWVAEYLGSLCTNLVVEWVPKDDPKVQLMLSTREDIFPDYTQVAFEEAFSRYFRIVRQDSIQDSLRILYLMGKK